MDSNADDDSIYDDNKMEIRIILTKVMKMKMMEPEKIMMRM